jgi:hypothetical protein
VPESIEDVRQFSGVAVLEVAQYAWLNPFGHEEF